MPTPPDDPTPIRPFQPSSAALEIAARLLDPSPRFHVEQVGPFPVDAFPHPVRDFLAASTTAARTPVEMVAAPFLALAGAAIGSRLRLDVGGGWVERPVLWVAVVGQTGTGKTPALNAVRRPFDLLQERSWTDWQQHHRAWNEARNARHPAGDGPVPAAHRSRSRTTHAGTSAPAPSIPPEPRPARVYTTDTTIDALVHDLQDSPGIAIVRDELVGILRGMQQSPGRRGDARQHYLSLWAHAPIAPSRHDPDAPFIRTPVVGIVGGIQPLLFAQLRSKDQDGFLERFLPVFTHARVDYWHEPDTASASEALPDAEGIADLLATLRTASDTSDPDGLLVTRDAAAREVWAAWYNDNVDRLRAVPLPVQGFYRKLPAHVARIALVLHALAHADDPAVPLSGETMTHATRVAECFRGHIHRCLVLLGEPGRIPPARPSLVQRALRLLSEADTVDRWLSRTVLYARLGRPDRDELTAALCSLADRNLVRTRRILPSGNRKPVEQWRVTTALERLDTEKQSAAE